MNAAIDESARVRDGASEEVRRTRGRCRTLEGRLRALLKAFQGEVSEQVALLRPRGPCLAAKFKCAVSACHPRGSIPRLRFASAEGSCPAMIKIVPLHHNVQGRQSCVCKANCIPKRVV